jgi:hypothetical protein
MGIRALVRMDDAAYRKVATILNKGARQPRGENQHRDRVMPLGRFSGRHASGFACAEWFREVLSSALTYAGRSQDRDVL